MRRAATLIELAVFGVIGLVLAMMVLGLLRSASVHADSTGRRLDRVDAVTHIAEWLRRDAEQALDIEVAPDGSTITMLHPGPRLVSWSHDGASGTVSRSGRDLRLRLGGWTAKPESDAIAVDLVAEGRTNTRVRVLLQRRIQALIHAFPEAVHARK